MKWLDRLEEGLISLLMGAATLVIAMAVLHRFLAGVPVLQDWAIRIDVSWAQELCIYMFVWMAKFGAAYGVRAGTHVGVDVVVRKLKPAHAKYLVIFSLLAGAVFTATIGTLGATFVWENGAHYAFLHAFGMDTGEIPEGPTSPDMEIPTWIAYACVPVGSYLMCFRFLQVCWHFIRTGDVPHADHGHVEGVEDTPSPAKPNALAQEELSQ
ncbi:TRAP transporter small permease [Roseateles sp. SL47]|uniref:TRAP transporter small permease n=1 Tax=Roseateles sp. SL47 TaxID=2995138 RepID=UPI0022709901|nr:TRAP transporter small permease [Roseateles sp. SL47]WAC73415.1 TRAP transporter small permease [Roseateles sp. SL47]